MRRWSRRWMALIAALAAGLAWAPGAIGDTPAPQEQAEPGSAKAEAQESDLVERIEVSLAEFRILVTDRRGNPITDLKPSEIEVFEEGKPQKLAFLEAIRDTTPKPTGTSEAPAPAPLYTAEGEVESSSVDHVLPAKPMRRVVLAFDVRNSKKRSREHWEEAALEWLRYDMLPEDWVSVVLLQSYPEWLVPFTRDRKLLASTVEAISLAGAAADRDRRREMNRLVQDIYELCSDPGRLPTAQEKKSTVEDIDYASGFDEQGCSYRVAEGYVQQWNVEAQESIDSLRALTGQVAAIPGRKAVLLFSEGIIEDATTLAVNAMMSVFGPQKIDMSYVTWTLNKNVLNDVKDLHEMARAADVSFFTFDTRQGHETGFGGSLEHSAQFSQNTLGINPWSEMDRSTRQTLNALAKETGGRSYHGPKDLADSVRAAADSFFGIYSVGYYRSDPAAALGKVKVKIDRKKLDVDYPDRASQRARAARQVALDLTVGAPRPRADGTQQLPIGLLMDFDSLPLRRGGGGRGTVLGLHLQAIRPDGSIAAERLDVETIVADGDVRRDAQGKRYLHQTSLTLPTGAYRIRARISDDRQQMIADRSIDLTLDIGDVRAGIRTVDPSSP